MWSTRHFCMILTKFEFHAVSNFTEIRGLEAALITRNDQRDWRKNNLIPFLSERPLLWQFNVAGENKTNISLYLKCQIFVPSFDQIWILWTALYKSPQYQILRGLGQGNRADISDRRTDRRTGMTKVTGGIYEYANASENKHIILETDLFQ